MDANPVLDAPEVAIHPLPDSVRTLWRVGVGIEAFVLLAAAIVAGVLVGSVLLAAGLIGVAIVIVAVRWAVVNLRHRYWRWGLDDRWLEQRQGVFSRRTQIVPRSRVQTLTTQTGPIDRWLGLSSLVVHTAGTSTPNLTIPHLDRATVEELRTELGR